MGARHDISDKGPYRT